MKPMHCYLLLKLNTRLGRYYGEKEVNEFVAALDTNKDGVIDLAEFKREFEKLLK